MNEENIPIKEIQKKLLEILIYFRDFCNENNLSFVLAGGTCLGAVRHKGFIPWDDDIDVFMFREDYEKLPELWKKYADTERYTCVRSNENYNIHHTATEIKDNNTTFINKHSVDLDIHQGIMIDVIPLDGVPKSRKKQFYQMINSMIYCCFNFQRLPEHKSKGIFYLTKLALGIIRTDKMRYILWHNAEKRMAKYLPSTCNYVASLGEGMTIMRQHFKKEWMENIIYMEFEGYRMPVPSGYNEFLTISYGNYMELPPVEERVLRHNILFMDLNTSYKKYRGYKYYLNKNKS
ncbi:LicD family protein [[Clostridium] symbiosum]|uniref:LicD family protein n=1 Tax=Clostridium symbiosum TaxID=1512 RepID=UPI001D069677|nr:LicD family protein [[Clostridium] symbiosum]MCB6608394.1 LicD family protein [[Clostridium] symbiosum]MCB6930608.1 LicD family protein [[Clostridium] symbiosum]